MWKTNVALIIFKKNKQTNKIYVFMMLILWKREKGSGGQCYCCFFFFKHGSRWQCYNSEMYNLQRCFSFSKKKLISSLWTVLFYLLGIISPRLFLYCPWCTCHCFIFVCLFYFKIFPLVWQEKKMFVFFFIFNTASIIFFAVSDPGKKNKEKKEGRKQESLKTKKWGKQWGLK